jgi:hypothetical protein
MNILICTLISVICTGIIKSQLYDFCATSESKEDCLKIVGCCYSTISIAEEKSSKTDEEDFSSMSFCFKRYKANSADTCKDYKSVAQEYENVLKECMCNEL